jgi:hypothetical protein
MASFSDGCILRHSAATPFDQFDELWQRVWLLRRMYAHDLTRAGALTIFEGPSVSNTLRKPDHSYNDFDAGHHHQSGGDLVERRSSPA